MSRLITPLNCFDIGYPRLLQVLGGADRLPPRPFASEHPGRHGGMRPWPLRPKDEFHFVSSPLASPGSLAVATVYFCYRVAWRLGVPKAVPFPWIVFPRIVLY